MKLLPNRLEHILKTSIFRAIQCSRDSRLQQLTKKKEKQQSFLIHRLNYKFPLGKWFRHFDLKNNGLYFSGGEKMSLELFSEFRIK